METSPTIGALSEALAKAQGAIKNPVKNREVSVKMRDNAGTYKFKYATFDGIIDAIRQPLTENGLWFMQSIDGGAMITRITHSSGEWIDSIIPMPGLNGKPQDIGSLITYFKRYGLSAALGIAVDEDDDANGAQGNEVEFTPRSDKRRPAATPAKPKLVSEAQVGTLRFKLTEAKASEAAFLDHIKLDALSNMRADKYDDAVALIESRKPKADAKPEAADLISDEIPHQEYAK